MKTLSAPKQFIYGFIGRFYQFAHRTDGEAALGPTWAGVIRWATLILLLVSWWRSWGLVGFIITVGLAVGIRLAFWLAKRQDYTQFVASKTAVSSPSSSATPLTPNERIELIATGRFSSDETEALALLRPATYWQLPVGDHTLMVEIENGRFLYQFFAPKNLASVTVGWLIYGKAPKPALAVTFQSEWGPEFADTTRAFYIRNRKKTDDTTRQHTIYLQFSTPQDQAQVQRSLTRKEQRTQNNTNETG